MFESFKFLYLKYAYFLRPLLILGILFAIPFGLYKGYSGTVRVWDNLAFINSYDSVVFKTFSADNYRPTPWENYGVSKSGRDSARTHFDSLYYEATRYWPISFSTMKTDTLRGAVEFEGFAGNDSLLTYTYVDHLAWDSAAGAVVNVKKVIVDADLLRLTDSVRSVLTNLNKDAIVTDTIYSLYIDRWVQSDTLQVKFLSKDPPPSN